MLYVIIISSTINIAITRKKESKNDNSIIQFRNIRKMTLDNVAFCILTQAKIFFKEANLSIFDNLLCLINKKET